MTLLTDRLAEQLKASQNAELALRAEVERLTAALRAILESNWDIDAMPHDIWQQARRALEGK